jgi:hypothetical protein
LAEADRREARAPAIGAKDHLVAVFEKGADFARGEGRRPGLLIGEGEAQIPGRDPGRTSLDGVRPAR